MKSGSDESVEGEQTTPKAKWEPSQIHVQHWQTLLQTCCRNAWVISCSSRVVESSNLRSASPVKDDNTSSLSDFVVHIC